MCTNTPNTACPRSTRRMIEILESGLYAPDRGLEFGSRRNTRLVAAHVSHLRRVEHDLEQYARVIERVWGSGNVDWVPAKQPSAVANQP